MSALTEHRSQHAKPDRPWYVVRRRGTLRDSFWYFGLDCDGTPLFTAHQAFKKYRAQGAASVIRMLAKLGVKAEREPA